MPVAVSVGQDKLFPAQSTRKGVIEMEVNTDILRIGETLYALKRIESAKIDINEELKELYEARHKQHVETLNDGVVNTAMEDWNTQINHIRSFEGKGQHAITAKHFDKPVMVHRGMFLLLRVILYSPTEMRTSWDYIRNRQRGVDVIPKIKKFCEEYTGTVLIRFRPQFCIPLVVGFCEKTGGLFTPFIRTFHTMSGGNVCTGNHTGKDFWKLSNVALEHEMNRINTFSPASSSVDVNGHRYGWREMINDQTVQSVQRRGASTWEV